MKVKCVQCNELKEKITHNGWDVSLDEKGRTWKGNMCPPCKHEYNKKYRTPRVPNLGSKICDSCMEVFKPYNTVQKFCSDPCRREAFIKKHPEKTQEYRLNKSKKLKKT